MDSGTLTLLIVVTFLRALVLTGMACAAVLMMRRLAAPRRRRRINPSIWSALMLLATSGTGMGLLSLRQALLWISDEAPWWFLLIRDPDLIGTIGYAVCSCFAGGGVVLLLHGLRGLLYYDVSGDLPRLRFRPPFVLHFESLRHRPHHHTGDLP